ncbi:MAG: hypothetical protein KME55_05300 [Nostoc indistinguendum CM1-VF10]|jgi:hypothetical protein|nr:hypothetical protein [Nostoc indistinguendum CM1-VF10]
MLTYARTRPKPLTEKLGNNSEIFKNSGLVEKFEDCYDGFSLEQKSEILDRFFSRQIPYNPS